MGIEGRDKGPVSETKAETKAVVSDKNSQLLFIFGETQRTFAPLFVMNIFSEKTEGSGQKNFTKLE